MKYILVLSFLIGSIITSYAQVEADSILSAKISELISQYSQHPNHQEAIQKILVELKKQDDTTYVVVGNKLLKTYDLSGQYKKLKHSSQEFLSSAKERIDTNSSDYITTLMFLANAHNYLGEYEVAESKYLKALTLYQNSSEKDIKIYSQLLTATGLLYKQMQRYEEAEPLYLQALQLIEDSLGTVHTEIIYPCNNLAVLYKDLNQWGKAEKYYKRAISIAEKLYGTDHQYYSTTLNNLGVFYKYKGDLDKAEKIYKEVLELDKKNLGEQHPYYTTSLSNLASLYVQSGRTADAEKILTKVLALNEQSLGKQHPYYIRTLNTLASINQNDLNKAIPNLLASLNLQISSTANYTDLDELLEALEAQPSFVYKQGLLGALMVLNQVLGNAYMSTSNLDILKQALRSDLAALRFCDRFRNEFAFESDKLRLLRFVTPFAQQGLRIATMLYEATQDKIYEEQAFQIAEQNKASLISNALHATEAQNFGNLPENLVLQEKQLQKSLSTTKKKLLEARDGSQKAVLQKNLNTLNQEITSFKKDLESKYPKYYNTKYQSNTVSVAELQKILSPNQALIQYFIGDFVEIFVVTKDSINMYSSNFNKKNFKNHLVKLREGLTNYAMLNQSVEKSFNTYSQGARWFYTNFIEHILPTDKAIDHLIIVPDNLLGYIPFEALLTEDPIQSGKVNFSTLPYLIKDYKISYTYSASLLTESYKNKHNNNHEILGVAASYTHKSDENLLKRGNRSYEDVENRSGLVDIPATQDEVHHLEEHFNGHFLYKDDATEKAFKEQAKDYGVIHLAMHGILNKKHPILSNLAFTKDDDLEQNNFGSLTVFAKKGKKVKLV
ncbi:MAG: tetratricopeptide repeat protein [Aureispira sp.]|nr:tetratricopeptide repeat protein [Aureispira sp.]